MVLPVDPLEELSNCNIEDGMAGVGAGDLQEGGVGAHQVSPLQLTPAQIIQIQTELKDGPGEQVAKGELVSVADFHL